MNPRPWCRSTPVPLPACALALPACGTRQRAVLGVGFALPGLALGVAAKRGRP